MKHLFLLTLSILFSIAISAQVSLKGKVTNANGEPLVGASILVKETFIGMPTGNRGEFEIHGLAAGQYTIQISYIGYEKLTKQVSIKQGENDANFVLKTASVLADEIIVAGTRAGSKVPVAYTDVSSEEIKIRNMGQDIPYLLSLTPSLVSTSDAGTGVGYTNFRIRGTDANRINITINGIPLNDAESHGVWWVNMPDFASSLENVQVQRGVGTSTNGAGAFGASINMQTNALQPEASAEWNSATGSFNTWKNTVSASSGLLNDKFTVDARLSKITSDGYIDRGSSELKSYFLSGAYYGPNALLKVNIFSGQERTYQAWNGVPSELLSTNRTYNSAGEYTDANGKTHYYDDEVDNYQQDHYQLIYSQKLNEHLNLNAALHYTYGRGYYEQFKEDEDLEDYLMLPTIVNGETLSTSDLIRRKWLDNDFYGMTFSLNHTGTRMDFTFGGAWNRYDGRHFGKVLWAQNFGPNQQNHEWYRSNGEKTDYNLYGKANFRFSDKLNGYLDMQYRHINYEIEGEDDDLRNLTQSHQFDFFNPKIGLFYSPSEAHDMYLSYARANREPNRSNYTDANPAGPQPKAETLNDFEAGYTFKAANFTAGASIYYMHYKDQLVLTGAINDVGGPVMTNAAKSYREGIELMAGWKINARLQWNASATFSRNKIKNFTEYVDDWDTWGQRAFYLGKTDIAFSPKLLANSTVSWKPTTQLALNFISQFVDDQFIDNTANEDRKLDAYFVNNLKVDYTVKSNLFEALSFSLMVNNLFDAEYESNAWVYSYFYGGERYKLDGYYPQAGINVMAGMNIRF